jgi:copper homeostasis protein
MGAYLREACVDSLESAIKAESLGADQLELCIDLDEDGLSPPLHLIKEVKTKVQIPVKVMVRLRKGNFVYTREELSEMMAYAKCCCGLGIDSFVTGMLSENHHIDLDHLESFAKAIPHASITFHKAIDLVTHPIDELKACHHIANLKYVLTSGGCPTALQGIKQLSKMVKELEPRYSIIPAGKITSSNLSEIHGLVGASLYHGKKIVE